MTIYVGNLSHQAKDQEVQDLFSEYGEVRSVNIIKDKMTGRSRGFAFVEMADDSAAHEAIEALHETEFLSRTIVVNEARPRTNDRPRGNFNRDRREGGNGGGGGGFNRNRY
jgi:RNA recognition motif-containing protein